MVASLAQYASALLLAFLNGYADANYFAASLMNNVDEGLRRLSVGKEVIDDEHLVGSVEVRT